MKEIRAYIEPYKLSHLAQALMGIPNFPGMSVTDCKGFGRLRIDQGHGFDLFYPKTRIEIFATDDTVDRIVTVIMQEAQTGNPGAGRLFVMPVLEGGHINTGLRGPEEC